MARLFIIGDRDGFTPQIARLVSMMEYARRTTLDAVAGLTMSQLDHVHDGESNSIGALLAHIAAVEMAYQASTFALPLTPNEAALDLGTAARRQIRGRSLDAYVNDLKSVRDATLRELAKRTDDWLYEEMPFWRDQPSNHYFQWFHVMEDELRKRLP